MDGSWSDCLLWEYGGSPPLHYNPLIWGKDLWRYMKVRCIRAEVIRSDFSCMDLREVFLCWWSGERSSCWSSCLQPAWRCSLQVWSVQKEINIRGWEVRVQGFDRLRFAQRLNRLFFSFQHWGFWQVTWGTTNRGGKQRKTSTWWLDCRSSCKREHWATAANEKRRCS